MLGGMVSVLNLSLLKSTAVAALVCNFAGSEAMAGSGLTLSLDNFKKAFEHLDVESKMFDENRVFNIAQNVRKATFSEKGIDTKALKKAIESFTSKDKEALLYWFTYFCTKMEREKFVADVDKQTMSEIFRGARFDALYNFLLSLGELSDSRMCWKLLKSNDIMQIVKSAWQNREASLKQGSPRDTWNSFDELKHCVFNYKSLKSQQNVLENDIEAVKHKAGSVLRQYKSLLSSLLPEKGVCEKTDEQIMQSDVFDEALSVIRDGKKANISLFTIRKKYVNILQSLLPEETLSSNQPETLLINGMPVEEKAEEVINDLRNKNSFAYAKLTDSENKVENLQNELKTTKGVLDDTSKNYNRVLKAIFPNETLSSRPDSFLVDRKPVEEVAEKVIFDLRSRAAQNGDTFEQNRGKSENEKNSYAYAAVGATVAFAVSLFFNLKSWFTNKNSKK